MYDRTSYGAPVNFTVSMLKTQKLLVYINNAPTTSDVLTFDGARFTSVYQKTDTPFTPGIFKARPIDQRHARFEVTDDSVCTQYPRTDWYKFVLSGQITPFMIAESPWNLMVPTNAATISSSYVDDTKRNLCLLGSAAKVAAPNVDAPVFLAELGATLRMLRKPLTLVAGGYKKFSRVPAMIRKNPSRVPKYLADKWLEYRYGLMPLIYDAEGIMDAVEQLKVKFNTQLRYTSSAMLGNKTPVTTMSQSWNDNLYGGCWRAVTTRTWYEFGVVGKTYYNYNMEALLSPSQVLGLDVYRLPEVAWELVPYSFVVDWFLNVGDWLGAHRIKPGVTIQGHTSGIKTIRYDQSKLDFVSFLDPTYYWASRMLPTGSYTKITESYLRTVPEKLPSFPVANWDYRDFNHVLDSLALLTPKRVK